MLTDDVSNLDISDIFDLPLWEYHNLHRAHPLSDDAPAINAGREDTDNDLELVELRHEVDDGGWLMVEQGPEVPVTLYDTSTVAPAELTAQAPASATGNEEAAPSPEDRQSGSDLLAHGAYLTPPPEYGGLPADAAIVVEQGPTVHVAWQGTPSTEPADLGQSPSGSATQCVETVSPHVDDSTRSGRPPAMQTRAGYLTPPPDMHAGVSPAGAPQPLSLTRSSPFFFPSGVVAPMQPGMVSTGSLTESMVDTGIPQYVSADASWVVATQRQDSNGTAGPSSSSKTKKAGPSKAPKRKAPPSSKPCPSAKKLKMSNDIPTAGGILRCEECDEDFATKENFRRHLKLGSNHITAGRLKYCFNSWCKRNLRPFTRPDSLGRHKKGTKGSVGCDAKRPRK
ncbi:hypothetical protein DFH11DRAFT_1591739 [Phellopilus nigrolimitatus]|nr:hypothetical protein DFH11DRAFT_1591739 [Phellopilus nigrolimitatus]